MLSGGVDSTCLAAIHKPELAIFVDYGHLSARGEAKAAKAISKRLGLRLRTICVDCSSVGSGQLVGRDELACAPVPEWWPYRNQLLLTLAAPIALTERIDQLLIGVVSSDRVHRDGTVEFLEQVDRLFRLQEGSLGVIAPGADKTTPQLIRESELDSSVLAWTHSCHIAAFACGQCRGCQKRARVLLDAGVHL